MFFRIFFCLSLTSLPAMAEPPVLQLPIDCELGKTCFIQQYMDLDDSKNVRDFGCGTASYDGHKGTDFRLLTIQDMEDGVNVIASASGRVQGTRNTVVDKILKTPEDRAAIKGKECGNGLVLKHADGWETQYCHLKQGSVTVKKGQSIEVGDVLGQVGLSGQTQFPHVHLSVRHNGKKVDPFLNPNKTVQCGELPIGNLWAEDLQERLAYQPTQIINLGFADGPITVNDIDNKTFQNFTPSRKTAALVGYVRAINLNAGDQVRITLSNEKGEIITNTYDPLERRKAVQFNFAGKKAPRGGWIAGEYIVTAEILRNDHVLIKRVLKRKILE
ncbi:M23 family metallopeptidase [Amylibacter sp. SFDW26]|uniref:M23 family metallopeptidase n=1 Tax=Amylibacter sp. SFDW26 TaxID=2652722 RepID=UPI00186AA0E9|nr:M23 family metallopeptidase [Amylibacter sp. SFDW26]